MLRSVYLVDSNELFREGLKRILADKRFDIEAVVDDLRDLLGRPDDLTEGAIVLIDVPAGDARIAGELAEAKARWPGARFVVLASSDDKRQLARYVAAGVDGYLFTTISADVLAGALHLIALGEKVFPSVLGAWLLEALQMPEIEAPAALLQSEDLSKREIDILGCLAEGLSNKMIARKLDISDATVKVHVKNVLKKMNVANRTQAAIWALRHNLGNGAPGFVPGMARAPLSLELQ